MRFEAVYHRASDNLCYSIDKDNLIVNIKTGYDVEKVFIYYGDPFDGGILGGEWKWKGKREEIPFKKRLKHQIWWTTTLKLKYKRCKYYFELTGNEETWFYFEDCFLSEKQMQLDGKMLQCFTFPWMNEADINKTPAWVNDMVWYQIFPERFCNGNPSINPKGVQPWHKGGVTNEEFYGGDLQGIINKLNYLKEIGITGIYLNPIFESPSAHKYDTTDYMKIDPNFGDENVFRKLVNKAHEKGIRIMLDGVFNHCGAKFGPWLDVLENGPSSKYYSWFMVNKWPFDDNKHDTKDGRFYSFAFNQKMPKLNTNNPEVIDYLIKVCEYWVKNYKIDGLRLDVANEISHKFCKKLREKMKSLNPDFYILGEIWHDSIPWLRGDEFDAIMNYSLTSSISDFWIDKSLTKDDFEYTINRCYTIYMQQNNDVLFNLLDSHDTERLISRVKDINVFYQQLAVLFTMPGSPCIFYGTEVALEGKYDPDCRRCMPWDEIKSGIYDDKINIMKALINLRKEQKLFRSRNFHFPNTIKNSRVIEYIKIDENENRLEILLNCSNIDVLIENNGSVLFSNLYSNNRLLKKGVLIRKIDSI
ncbi:glycoside hydrolase family 13 protein [Clostridium sp. YIM B02555]|uniref:glycoside hydrolase family 13 protein n=1 Tax=Clostridium sp. YIM B02555 TaxID=2911968 RepID=UPI001EEEDC38|nr:glycoside hydrolase family 13 protein [Clostridium sp. YIM B02555]